MKLKKCWQVLHGEIKLRKGGKPKAGAASTKRGKVRMSVGDFVGRGERGSEEVRVIV